MSRRGADILARAKAILLSPRTEWPALAQENTDIGTLYVRYALPLAAIPPLCKLIGWSLLLSYMGFGIGLASALLSYGLGLAAIGMVALIACRLAPLFEGEADMVQAFKLIIYSATPGWLGGVFRLVPGLGILSVPMSLYSVYLLYTGARPLLAVPEDRVVGYTVAVVVVAVIVFLLVALILTALVGVTMIGMV
ncbi:MAG TPA: Yip1 family protein [Stellaceae bacterium]